MNKEDTPSQFLRRDPPALSAYPLRDACGHDHEEKVVYLCPGFSTNGSNHGGEMIGGCTGRQQESLTTALDKGIESLLLCL